MIFESGSELARRCGLPGCDAVIEREPGHRWRKYCCETHRVAARKLRLEQSLGSTEPHSTDSTEPLSTDSTQPPSAHSTDVSPTADESDRLVEPTPSRQPADGPVVPPDVPWSRSGVWPTVSIPGSGSAALSDGTARLARLVRMSGRPLAADASMAVARRRPDHAPVSAADRRRRQQRARSARRRAVAVLGALGILAGGVGLAAPNEPAGPAMAQPPTPQDVDLAGWAAQAQAALDSVNHQLEVAAQAHIRWLQSPLSQDAAGPPALVRELINRIASLEHRRLLLQSALAAFRDLDGLHGDLLAIERQLANLDRALAALPYGPSVGPQDRVIREGLLQQRDMLIRQREAKSQELASVRREVESAARRPVPDPADRTTPLAQSVADLSSGKRQPGPGPGGQPDSRPPSVLAQRGEAGGRERADVANGASPAPPAEGAIAEVEPAQDRSQAPPARVAHTSPAEPATPRTEPRPRTSPRTDTGSSSSGGSAVGQSTRQSSSNSSSGGSSRQSNSQSSSQGNGIGNGNNFGSGNSVSSGGGSNRASAVGQSTTQTSANS